MIAAAEAIEKLKSLARTEDATAMAQYHKAPRTYLGTKVPNIDACVRQWKTDASTADRVHLAHGLWDSDIHEARLAATRLLTQARIREDEPLVWAEFLRWVPTFDAWALADHACGVGNRRLVAHPERLDVVETWTRDPNKWVRRAALVATLPWTKQRHPDEAENAIRESVLTWAAAYVPDQDWFIQKAIAWWLRSLSDKDPARVRAFLDGPGQGLKSFARKDASRKMA